MASIDLTQVDSRLAAAKVAAFPCLLSVLILFLILVIFLISPCLAEPPVQAGPTPQLSPISSRSGFVDALEIERRIPRGARLERLADFFKKKIRLRSDVAGEPVPAKDELKGLFALTDLEAGSILLRDAVTTDPAGALAAVVPPHRLLITLVGGSELAGAALCGPYDQAVLSAAGAEGAEGTVISTDARVISSAIDYGAPRGSIVVVAIKEPEQRLLESQQTRGKSDIRIACSDLEKY